MILTVVQADIGGSSSKRFFPGEPTESVHTVIEADVDDRFSELDRTLDKSAAVERRRVADGKRSTVNPLRIISASAGGHQSIIPDYVGTYDNNREFALFRDAGRTEHVGIKTCNAMSPVSILESAEHVQSSE